MTDYEIVATYLNGCAGAAYPQTSFDEATLADTDDFVKAKHGEEFHQFKKETTPAGQIVYTFSNGAVTYIYEFTKI